MTMMQYLPSSAEHIKDSHERNPPLLIILWWLCTCRASVVTAEGASEVRRPHAQLPRLRQPRHEPPVGAGRHRRQGAPCRRLLGGCVGIDHPRRPARRCHDLRLPWQSRFWRSDSQENTQAFLPSRCSGKMLTGQSGSSSLVGKGSHMHNQHLTQSTEPNLPPILLPPTRPATHKFDRKLSSR